MSVWIDVGCLFLLICVNGFFAMSEIAIVTARRTKLQMLAEDEAPGARLALMLSEIGRASCRERVLDRV